MQLLASGRDSLAIFKPSSFKLFALVTLKSLRETYKVWLKYWGWLIAILVAKYLIWGPGSSLITFLYLGAYQFWVAGTAGTFSESSRIIALMSSLLHVFIIVSLVISVRPSAGLKNYHYINHYKVHFVYAALWFFVVPPVLVSFVVPFLALPALAPHSFIYLALLSTIVGVILALIMPITTLLCMLFLFDSDGTPAQALKSVWRALKMVIYNLQRSLKM